MKTRGERTRGGGRKVGGRPWRPLGRALTDFVAGRRKGKLEVVLDDGRRLEYPIPLFFRTEFSDVEETALELCRGRVLEVGCGTGSHALQLQKRGFDVVGLDVDPSIVDIARARGVRSAVAGDVWSLDEGSFDSILFLMNGWGMVEDREGLGRFLERCRELLTPGGRILGDSSDLTRSAEARDRQGWEEREARGDDPRCVRMRWAYGGKVGDPFTWYYVDPEMLESASEDRGWRCQLAYQDGDGVFLAVLRT